MRIRTNHRTEHKLTIYKQLVSAMKTPPVKFIALIFAPVAALVCASCSTAPPPVPVRDSANNYIEGIPGGVTVDTYEVTTAVSAIDHEKRTATLLTSDGTEIPYKAGP